MDPTLKVLSGILTKLIVLTIMVLGGLGVAYSDNVTTAGLELANTFQQINTFVQGAKIGNVSILPGGGNYNITLPAQVPPLNGFLVNSSTTPGVLTWSQGCSGFQANGDLGGNATSQLVVGINGIPIDTTVPPQDGWALKYKASTGKWTPQP
jgi:hypothetical protein